MFHLDRFSTQAQSKLKKSESKAEQYEKTIRLYFKNLTASISLWKSFKAKSKIQAAPTTEDDGVRPG